MATVARFLRSTALVQANRLARNVVPRHALFAQPTASMATIREPANMVSKGVKVRPQTVKIPYLPDAKKQEIYARYITDPEKWTVSALAQHYNASPDRIKAIVHLLHTRCEMMKEMGLEVSVQAGKGDRSPPTILVAVPKIVKALYEKHVQQPEESLSKLLSDFNAAASSEDDKAKMNEEELKIAIENVKEHYRRQQNVRAYEVRIAGVLGSLRNAGASTHFQEVPRASSNQGFERSYFPKLLDDYNFDKHKEKLLERVRNETLGQVDTSVEFYEAKSEETKDVKTADLATNKTNPIRWKMAFKDTSKGAVLNSATHFSPTTIRTRTGEIRNATPLEEMNRSWNPRYQSVDFDLTQKLEHLTKKFLDPHRDEEEHFTAEISKAKAEKRKKIAAESGKKK